MYEIDSEYLSKRNENCFECGVEIVYSEDDYNYRRDKTSCRECHIINQEKYEKEFLKHYKYIEIRETSEEYKKLRRNLRASIRVKFKSIIKNPNNKNKNKFNNRIGCTIEEYKEHISKYFKFDNKMNWENYGKYWDVDHITPIDYYDLTKESEIEKAFNYKNVRALRKSDNYLLSVVLNKNTCLWTKFSYLKPEKREKIMKLKDWKL